MAPFLIAVLGAGGKTGLEVVKAALARGDSVRAIVRDPSKYDEVFKTLLSDSDSSSSSPSPSGKLDVVSGDVEASPDDLAKLLSGADAAVFAASASKTGDVWKVDRDGVGALAAAAKSAKLKHLVVVSSALVTPTTNGWHPIRLLLNNMRGGGQKIMDAKFAGEELLRRSGFESYTVVRPGGLVDASALGAAALVVAQGDRSGAGRIPRRDVAELCVAAAHAEGDAAKKVTLEVSSDAKRAASSPPTSYESLFAGLEKDATA